MKNKKRPYMSEPDYGNAEPTNTSRIPKDLGTTDNPKKDESRKAPESKPDIQQISEQARKEARARLEQRRKEREQPRGAGREDMMSRQRQRMIMEREERKKKNEKDRGGSSVV